jgi:phosphate transport system substrate-binding protein
VKENSTSAARRNGAVLAWLLAGCTMGADPDPRGVAMPTAQASGRLAHDGPLLVVASPGALQQPASAPLAEPRAYDVSPPQHRLVVGVGQNVAHVVDKAMEEAFVGQRDDLRAAFTSFVDRDVLDALLMGQADFGVIGGQLSVREQHAGLRQNELGLELFALAVAPDSPLRSLTPMQVRQIFTGQVTEWTQLGLTGGTIVPVVPADPALAQRAARVLMPGDDFAATVTRVASLRHVADQALRNPGAIGIVRITDQALDRGLKLLQIDWTAPSFDSFHYGTYPYALPLQLVSSGTPTGEALRFLEFSRSDAGRELLGRALCTR